MTPQLTLQTNIPQSKGDQTMKLGQFTEYNKRNIFFKKNTEHKARRLVKGLFLFFKKSLFEVDASGLQLSFNTFQ